LRKVEVIKCGFCGDEKVFMHEEEAINYKCDCKRPLLTIELEDETSVPKVIYKGEELTSKKKVKFEWETQREHAGTGGVNFWIEHFDKETESLHIIGRRNGEHL